MSNFSHLRRAQQREARRLAADTNISYQQALERLRKTAPLSECLTKEQQTIVSAEACQEQPIKEAAAALVRQLGVSWPRAWNLIFRLRVPGALLGGPQPSVFAPESLRLGSSMLVKGKDGFVTSWMRELAGAAAARSMSVLYFSLEQSAEVCENHLATYAAGLALSDVFEAKLALPANLQVQYSAPQKRYTVAEIAERLAGAGADGKPTLLCVDSLYGIGTVSGAVPNIEERLAIANELTALAAAQQVVLVTSLSSSAFNDELDGSPDLGERFDRVVRVWRLPGEWWYSFQPVWV